MKKKKTQLETKKGKPFYSIDKKTRRATFLANNQAALIHGGYSKNIPVELMDSVLNGDLGFELGVLKGQLANLALLGDRAVKYFSSQGDDVSALQIAISCSDCTSRLVPQINKLLESHLSSGEDVDNSVLKMRTRWLKKLRAGGCSPVEVAYQFEVNELGELPHYVQIQVDSELKNAEPELAPELYTREELNQKLQSYWDEVDGESEQLALRKHAIDLEKQRINEQFFGVEVKSKDTGGTNGES